MTPAITTKETSMIQSTQWNFDMSACPKDGRMLQLLVRGNDFPFDDASVSRTVGFNQLKDIGEDVWQLAGWDWDQDCFTEAQPDDSGRIEVLAWAPMLELPSAAEIDIVLERRRQIEVEGWTPEHDDQHDDGELLRAAVIYYHHATNWPGITYEATGAPTGWPWSSDWWKPKDARRDLVRAGALCVAEAERLKRVKQRHHHVVHKFNLIMAALEALDGDAALWCCHVRGPDDVVACDDKAHAERLAAKVNEFVAKHLKGDDPNAPVISAVAAPWPWSAEAHARDLAEPSKDYAAQFAATRDVPA